LFKADKNSMVYKALVEACASLNIHPARWAVQSGALASARDLHLQMFLAQAFPKGAAHQALPAPKLPALPVADVQAFSIDDITTTEIDDAFSVRLNMDGSATVGIHIAAPGLAIAPGDAIDKVARERMSTVYMPGDKITMLPDSVVHAFTLEAGRTMPAVSLYATVGPDGSIGATETRIEAVPMAANLRHNLLDDLVTAESLDSRSGDYPFAQELAVLWRAANWISGERDKVRGKPENNNRTDFSFYMDPPLVDGGEPQVRIEIRKRGAPLDKIVSELMILANSTWARQLTQAGLPGVFRSQRSGPGGSKVRMSTHAAPHEAMGVTHYGWFTSPLRRYSDLVNQWQLLALVEYGAVAALKAPHKPKDADLFAVISAFDAAYGAYADFQSKMERYWCLRWLAQNNIRDTDAVAIKEDLLRLARAPLYLHVAGVPAGEGYARGRPVHVAILGWDEIDLSIQARYLGEGALEARFNAIETPDESDDAVHAADAVALPEIEPEAAVNP
jgi:exoribonuclease-2